MQGIDSAGSTEWRVAPTRRLRLGDSALGTRHSALGTRHSAPLQFGATQYASRSSYARRKSIGRAGDQGLDACSFSLIAIATYRFASCVTENRDAC